MAIERVRANVKVLGLDRDEIAEVERSDEVAALIDAGLLTSLASDVRRSDAHGPATDG